MKVEVEAYTNNWKDKPPAEKHRLLMTEDYAIRQETFTLVVSMTGAERVEIAELLDTIDWRSCRIEHTVIAEDPQLTIRAWLTIPQLIRISRMLLCHQVAQPIRRAWSAVISAVSASDPVVASVCVPNCIYRGFCPRTYIGCTTCAYVNTHIYRLHRDAYIHGIQVRMR